MNKNTAEKLLALNRQFYQTFALQFSQTRLRLQPGVRQILNTLPRDRKILDLGCGNGELAHQLAKLDHQGLYVGIDLSKELLERARGRLGASDRSGDRSTLETQKETKTAESLQKGFRAIFIQRDLATPDWDETLPGIPFEIVFAFAVMHHLPGHKLRCQVLLKVHNLLKPDGKFIHSEWQFLNSPRLRARIQPWESVGVDPDSVDQGDYLLDWRRGGYGFRYAHHFSQPELARLAEETGFKLRQSFHSDGKGGNLGLYQVWEAA